jgi:outer membrane receptor protein involved in Fe transport
MKNISLRKAFLCHGVAGLALSVGLIAQSAQAQSSNEAKNDDNVIIVTGSRIQRPNLDSPVPITTVSGDSFFQTGETSVGDRLNQLPQLRSTLSQSNSTNSLGTSGLNLLDLRGLGTQRTLVLQNGRRHVAGDILNNAVSPDINTFPTALIERVDIVTGGDSAIYGSDAIAGVVNFVLKRNYEGFEVRGQSGISKYGDDGEIFTNALYGTNFSEGRGNITVDVEYSHHGNAFASHRPNLRVNSRFVTVDTDPGSAPSDGVFDNEFHKDVRFPFFNNGGELVTCCTIGASGGFNLGAYLFQPDGTLIPQTGILTGNDYFDTRFLGGNGSTAREGNQLILQPVVNRYSINTLGHYDVSDAFKPFFEAKYVKTMSRGSTSGPFFFGLGTPGTPRDSLNTSNPFLNPQARAVIQDYYGAAPDEDVDFGFSRTVTDLGVRDEIAKRDTYRIVVGVEGDIGDGWKYEVSGNYGSFRERTKVLGNVNVQRFLLAKDAVDEGQFLTGTPNGNIVCRAQLDPAAAVPYEFAVDSAFASAALANDVTQCRPANLFGEGNMSQAAKDYILQDTISKGKITQLDFTGYISGDSEKWFSLPGGPIGMVVGFEYRRETARYQEDPLVESGVTFYNVIPTFNPPAFEVKEVFGELRVPLLKDIMLVKEFTLNGAARYSDYKGKAGTSFAYNGGAEWVPVEGFRFRGNYSRAVRAPNLVELYQPLGQNFATVDDPCSADNIGTGTQFREANCRAAGIPDTYNYQYTATLQFESGGNPNLKPEKSDSWTIGLVAQPPFIPGFSFSVDYYNIKVNNVITSPAAQDVINACYDLESANNQFCGLFQRAGTGGGPRGEEQFRILEDSLQNVLLNYAKLKVRGLDFDVGYRHDFGAFGVNAHLYYTRVLQNDQFLDPTDPTFADQVLLELNDPQDRFTFDLDLKHGPVTLGYEMRYIGHMVVNNYEDFFSVQGRPPQNADYSEQRFYPHVFYHDIRIGIEIMDKSEVYIGCENIANKVPPLGLTGVGAGSAVYSNVGRFFYAGVRANF